MIVKTKHLIGIGCIAVGLAAGTANAKVNWFEGGECYLGGSFGKAFSGKKISGRTIPIAKDVGWVTDADTQELTFKKGNAMSFFLGTKIADLRYQLEFSSVETKYKKFWNNNESGALVDMDGNPRNHENIKCLSVTPQIFYDFSIPNSKELIPYVGAGLGYSKIKNYLLFEGNETEKLYKENKLTGQLIAGVRYKFADNLAVSLDYKYFRPLGKIKALSSSYYNHSVQAGIVVNI